MMSAGVCSSHGRSEHAARYTPVARTPIAESAVVDRVKHAALSSHVRLDARR